MKLFGTIKIKLLGSKKGPGHTLRTLPFSIANNSKILRASHQNQTHRWPHNMISQQQGLMKHRSTTSGDHAGEDVLIAVNTLFICDIISLTIEHNLFAHKTTDLFKAN